MTILDAIVARKEQELHDMPFSIDVQATQRSFVSALRARKPAVIAEVKLRSPSAGDLLDRSSVPTLVEAYSSRAQAISVLCDQQDFGGGYDLLADVRAMTDLPILAKEFIIDLRQVRMARSAGADAILLIGAILSAERCQSLADVATDLGMDVLFEIHDTPDLEKIPHLSANDLLLGINNRDLRTLKADFAVTEALAPLAHAAFPECFLIAESGVQTRQDVERLTPFVDGFLIGETFLRSNDIERCVRELFTE